VNASQKRELQFAQNVSQVFLGMNMKCASCHDSFIDRWTLAQTYGLAAVCTNGPLEMYRCDKPLGKSADAAWMFERTRDQLIERVGEQLALTYRREECERGHDRLGRDASFDGLRDAAGGQSP